MDTAIIVAATLLFLGLLRFAYWTGKVITIAQHKAQLRRTVCGERLIRSMITEAGAKKIVDRYLRIAIANEPKIENMSEQELIDWLEGQGVRYR